jgi:hypothetical protein
MAILKSSHFLLRTAYPWLLMGFKWGFLSSPNIQLAFFPFKNKSMTFAIIF